MRRWACVAVGLVVAACLGSTADRALAADDQFASVQHTDYVYSVDLATRSVHVTANLRVLNDGAYGDRTCLDEFQMRFPAGATNARVMDRIVPLDLQVVPPAGDEVDATVRVELQECLQYGRQDGLELTYDLPAGAPRSNSPARASDEYVAFVAWGAGRAGGSSITVELPAAFTADSLTDGWVVTEQGAITTYTKGPIKDPSTYTVVVSAHADGASGERVSAGGRDFTLIPQNSDEAWLSWVSEQLVTSLTTLESAVGVPWPEEEPVTIFETFSPTSPDATPWSGNSGRLYAGEQLDEVSLQRGLAAAWFSSEQLADGWLADALGDSYAGIAVEPDSAAAVIDGLRDEIGNDTMTDVITDVMAGTSAYGTDNADGPMTWRQFLDLVEERGGVTDAQDALAQFVDPAEGAALEERPAARAAYVALRDRGGEWTPPLGVRTAMDEWDFATATELITAADTVLDQVDTLREALDGTGIALPDSLGSAYASATTTDQLADLASQTQAQTSVASTLARAVATERETGGLIDTVGLISSDLDERLDDAKAAFADGDIDVARTNAFRAITEASSATFEGVKRLVLAWGFILAALVVALTVRDLRRLLRTRQAPVAA